MIPRHLAGTRTGVRRYLQLASHLAVLVSVADQTSGIYRYVKIGHVQLPASVELRRSFLHASLGRQAHQLRLLRGFLIVCKQRIAVDWLTDCCELIVLYVLCVTQTVRQVVVKVTDVESSFELSNCHLLLSLRPHRTEALSDAFV